MVAVAVIVAALYGTAWAPLQLLLKRTSELPFGPFLSLGSLTVMVFHDGIAAWIAGCAADMSLLLGA